MDPHRTPRAGRIGLAIVTAAGLPAFGAGAWMLPWPAGVLAAVGLAGWWCWYLDRDLVAGGPAGGQKVIKRP